MSSAIVGKFEEAAGTVSSGSIGKLTQKEQLDLYGLFARVRKGVAPDKGPSAVFDPTGYAKWTAWSSESHLTEEEAMDKYIALVDGLSATSRPDEESGEPSSDGFGSKASTGFDLSYPDDNSEGIKLDICYWATMGDPKAVQRCLLEHCVPPDYRDADGLTALMRAADRNRPQVVDVLVQAGADLNAQDGDGQTALHYAVYCEHSNMVGLLVAYGASDDVKDGDGISPFDVSVGETRRAIVAAKGGLWQRNGVPFRADPWWRKLLSGNWKESHFQLMAAVSIAVVGITMYYCRKP